MGGEHSRHVHNIGGAGDITEVANFDFRDFRIKGEEEEGVAVKPGQEVGVTVKLREGVTVHLREGLDTRKFERRETDN